MDAAKKGLIVRQSNKLIEASYKIASVGEGRLISMLIAQIKPEDEDFKMYRISVADFVRFFGLQERGGKAYEMIKRSADDLAGRRIMIENGNNWLRMNWLSSAEYKEGSGYVELCFDKKLKPYLLQLKGYYTQYDLEIIIHFKSLYSMRIFELLKMEQFKADKNGSFSRTFEYDDLRRKLGIGEDEYKQFKDFRVRAIQPAVKEINANPDIRITQVDYPKTGRKISHIVFHCEKAKQLQLDVDEPLPKFEIVDKPKEHPDYIKELLAIGIDEESAYKWKKKYGVARLRDSIKYTQAMQQAGKIKESVTGFLVNALQNNIGTSWIEDQEKKQQEKKEAERKRAIEAAKEEQKQAEERAKREALFIEFLELPEQEKLKVRKAFEASQNTIILKIWNGAKRANPDSPESEGKVKTQFLIFYKSYRDELVSNVHEGDVSENGK